MWNILGYIATAVAMEILTQLMEQDRENMRQRAQALQDRQNNNRLLDGNNCARSAVQDKINALEKEYDKLDADSADRNAKLKDLDSKYKALRQQSERLQGEAWRIIDNGFKIDNEVNRAKYLRVEFNKLRPKLTTNLTKMLGVVSALASLAQLAQYAKEKMEDLKNQQNGLRDEIDSYNCSSTSSLAQTFDLILEEFE